jgi:hypothetical protein
MAIEDLVKEATRAFAAQLTEALEGMAEDLGRAARDDRETAVARATDVLAKELEEAEKASKTELERAVAEEVARVREEVEEAAIARIEAARVEAQQSADARVEAERAVVRQAADAEISRVRVEAEARRRKSSGPAWRVRTSGRPRRRWPRPLPPNARASCSKSSVCWGSCARSTKPSH